MNLNRNSLQFKSTDSILPVLNFTLNVSKRNFTRRIGDILVNAATGSGKTLAYSIPIVQTLFKRQINRLRCIIIVPTKLLINQVYTTLTKLTQGTSLIVSIAKLENSLKDEHKKLSNLEPDILITTPGRLVDHLNMKSINLKNLKFLIIDEADRL
nr:CMF_HP1_G0048680.mRNA.1.CDS.1 [Saccharomyces cerevisiae]